MKIRIFTVIMFGLVLFSATLMMSTQISYAADQVIIQDTDSSFKYYNDVGSSADSSTSDNSSAKMSNDSVNWNITYLKSDFIALKPGILYDIYFKVKVKHATTNPTGSAFKMAVWDNTHGAHILSPKFIPASDTQDMVWEEYKIGTFKPNSSVNQLVFYVAGVNNAAQVSDIYVDYIVFKEHVDYTIEDTDFVLYSDSIGATVSNDPYTQDNSAAVLNNGPVAEWAVQAPIDMTQVEAGVPYIVGFNVYPERTDWDTSSGDMFGYLVYNNTMSSYVIPPTVIKSTDFPMTLEWTRYYNVRTAPITFNPAHTYHVAFYKVDNAAHFQAVKIDKVYLQKETPDDNQIQVMDANKNCIAICVFPYKISPSNQDGLHDTTEITYELPSMQTIDVSIFNTNGNTLVRQLINGASQSGEQMVVWDGKNDAGQFVANGLYVVKISNATQVLFKKNVQVVSGIELSGVPTVNHANDFIPRMVWFDGGLVPKYDAAAAAAYLNAAFNDISLANANTVSIVNMPSDHAELWFDIAADHNLKIIGMPLSHTVYSNEALANDETAMYTFLSNLVTPVMNKTALLQYYLRDEPPGDARTIYNLKQTKRILETIDPDHAVNFVFDNILAVSELNAELKPDALLNDIYPVTHLDQSGDPEAVGDFTHGYWDFTDQMDYFKLQTRKDIDNPAPYWLILQAFGGPSDWNKPWRNPTEAELRAMTYMAIGHDTKGFGYFVYQSEQGWTGMIDHEMNHTTRYSQIQTLFSELSSMEETILNMKRIGNAATASGGGLSTLYDHADITTHEDKLTGDKYLVVVNHDVHNSQNVTITIDRAKLGMDISSITNVYDNANISFTAGSNQYTINDLSFTPGSGKILKLTKSNTAFIGQDASFYIYNGATKNNDDVSASDSKSAMKIVQSTNGWDMQWWWDKTQLTPGVTYDLYVDVKIRYANDTITSYPYSAPPIIPSGQAFKTGIYDVTAGVLIGSPVDVAAASMENMLWHTIKVGTFIPSQTNTQYVYVYPANNPSQIYAVYVDRYYFVPQ